MFIYKGFYPVESGMQPKVKNFDDEYDAIEFANDNAIECRRFEVIDDECDEVIHSHKIAKEEEEAILDSMFPEEEDKENFDPNDFFED